MTIPDSPTDSSPSASALRATTERAAGIEYAFVARPADVPTEYDAPASISLRFLVIKAIDGSRVEAALWQPGDRPVNATTLVIDVHGSGGTFHGLPNGFLSQALAAQGYGVLGINTRQSGTRVNTDNFLVAGGGQGTRCAGAKHHVCLVAESKRAESWRALLQR